MNKILNYRKLISIVFLLFLGSAKSQDLKLNHRISAINITGMAFPGFMYPNCFALKVYYTNTNFDKKLSVNPVFGFEILSLALNAPDWMPTIKRVGLIAGGELSIKPKTNLDIGIQILGNVGQQYYSSTDIGGRHHSEESTYYELSTNLNGGYTINKYHFILGYGLVFIEPLWWTGHVNVGLGYYFEAK